MTDIDLGRLLLLEDRDNETGSLSRVLRAIRPFDIYDQQRAFFYSASDFGSVSPSITDFEEWLIERRFVESVASEYYSLGRADLIDDVRPEGERHDIAPGSLVTFHYDAYGFQAIAPLVITAQAVDLSGKVREFFSSLDLEHRIGASPSEFVTWLVENGVVTMAGEIRCIVGNRGLIELPD